jgi:imidazolonepropionase-like amidohydrolase
MRTILDNVTVVAGTGAEPVPNMSIVISNGRIEQVAAANARAGGDDRVLDLAGCHVLPGLWAVHTHLGAIFPDAKNLTLRESTADRTIRAGRNSLDALRAGFTSLRVVGERDGIDEAWKRAFAMGLMVGPNVFTCGNAIIATGGHGHDSPGVIEVDGPHEARKAVRSQLKRGVDQIKLMTTGGVATAGEGMQESQMFLDEIEAATAAAHQKGKRVCVHAGGPEGVKDAIRGGVDCIEHGYYLDDEAIDMMVEHGTYWVPTLFVTQHEEFMRRSGMHTYQIEKASGAKRAHREGFQKALAAGVKIACGADSSPIDENTRVEIEQLVACGMTPLQAITAATRTSAELCQADDRSGTIEAGKVADLVVLDADPIADISNIRHVRHVFSAGRLVETAIPEGQSDFWDLYF